MTLCTSTTVASIITRHQDDKGPKSTVYLQPLKLPWPLWKKPTENDKSLISVWFVSSCRNRSKMFKTACNDWCPCTCHDLSFCCPPWSHIWPAEYVVQDTSRAPFGKGRSTRKISENPFLSQRFLIMSYPSRSLKCDSICCSSILVI